MLTTIRRRLPKGVRAPLGRTAHRMKDSELTWRYGPNLVRSVRYVRASLPLESAGEQLMHRFRADGVATISMGELLGDALLLDEMLGEVEVASRQRAEEAEALRLAAAETTSEAAIVGGETKSYVQTVLRSSRSHDTRRSADSDSDSPFVRFGLHPAVTSVVNAYFRMYSHFRNYRVWHSFPTATVLSSQKWHRDPEDRIVVKVFINLSHVEMDQGPFTYARGTGYYGDIRAARPELFVRGKGTHADRRSDDEMADIAPPARWHRAIGPPGTVTFADTSGFHKGGHRTEERLVGMLMYTSNLAEW